MINREIREIVRLIKTSNGRYETVKTPTKYYTSAEVAAQSPLRSNYTELVSDEIVVSRTCEEVDEVEAKLYWVNKNNR